MPGARTEITASGNRAPAAEISNRSKIPILLSDFAIDSNSFLSALARIGTTDWERVPSPNKRLKIFGARRAIKNRSVVPVEPKIEAIIRSLKNPAILLMNVGTVTTTNCLLSDGNLAISTDSSTSLQDNHL